MNIPDEYKFKIIPYKHQIKAIEYGLNHDKWLLADEMGMGKTKTVIEIANIKKVKHCLIICCDNGLKWNWRKEVGVHSEEKCFILGQHKVNNKLVIGSNIQRLKDLDCIKVLPRFIITNIDTLKYRVPTGEKVERKVRGKIKLTDRYRYPITEKLQELCESGEIDMIAVDEFHVVKNEDTESARQILKIHTPIQIAITGTPVMNNPLDIFMSLKWLGYENRPFWEFKHRYCRLGGYNGNDVIGYRNLEEIADTLSNMMLRRLKKNSLDLPDKIFVNEYVEMNSKQAAIYNEVRNNMLNNIDEIKQSSNPLARFTRLRQATGYTGILSSIIKVSTKFDRMEEIVNNAVDEGKKVVIFSNWSQIVIPAYERLSKKHKGLIVTGEIKDNIRQERVDRFQNDSDVSFIIGTIDTIGKGYDLYSGTVEIFLDDPWNMEIKNQAVDRCHRIGASSNIIIYTLICEGTVDERVSDLVERKGAMSDIFINGDCKTDKNELINYLLS